MVKNKSKCCLIYRGLYSYRRVRVIAIFPNTFSYCFCMLGEFAKVFERKVWLEQVAHLHNLGVFNCQQISKKISFYLWYYDKKQIECGLGWSVLLSTTIRVITVVKICCGLTRLRPVSPTTFWPLWWRILAVDKNTDNAKPNPMHLINSVVNPKSK